MDLNSGAALEKVCSGLHKAESSENDLSKPTIRQSSTNSDKLSIALTAWAVIQVGFGVLLVVLSILDLLDLKIATYPLVGVAVPHFVLAIGLWWQRRWSLWLGLIYSALLPGVIIVSLWLGEYLFPSSKSVGIGPGGPGAGIGAAITFLIMLVLAASYWLVNVAGFGAVLLLQWRWEGSKR